MKAFIASLLASATMAANKATWTGTKATAGDLGATPSGSSSWSGTANTVAVTWATSVSLTNAMADNDYVQAWWCMPYGSSTDCNLWQWERDGSNYIIKGKNYRKSSTTIDSAIPVKKPKKYFDDTSAWSEETWIEYKQTGATGTPAKTQASEGNYKYVSSKVNGKTLTGNFKRTYTATQTDKIESTGESKSGVIGVFADDDSKSKEEGAKKTVTIAIKKKPTTTTNTTTTTTTTKTTTPKTTTGAKKTWVGPSVTHESNTVKAGGFTQWTKTNKALQSWLCQTATATTAFADNKETAQPYLWDTTAKQFWLWTFRKNEIKYYDITAPQVSATEDDEIIKNQISTGSFTENGKSAMDYANGALTVESGGKYVANTSLDTTKSKIDTAFKNWTGCLKTATTSNSKEKGSTKAYKQGIWYSKDEDEDGKRVEIDVSVVVAAEGASTLLTTLGAFAVGVAALAF